MSHEQSQPKRSFYSVIPAYVRKCKELEYGAMILYGDITALAEEEGYCWASNAYFAELFDVDVSTIKRWLQVLARHEFITIDTKKDSIHWQRRIWIGGSKKILTKAQKCAPPSSKMSPPQLKNEPHIYTAINTEDKKEPPFPPDPGGSAQENKNFSLHPEQKKKLRGPHVLLSDQELASLQQEHGAAVVNVIIEEMNDYISAKGKKPYRDYAAAVRQWARRRKKETASDNPPAHGFGKVDRQGRHADGTKFENPYSGTY